MLTIIIFEVYYSGTIPIRSAGLPELPDHSSLAASDAALKRSSQGLIRSPFPSPLPGEREMVTTPAACSLNAAALFKPPNTPTLSLHYFSSKLSLGMMHSDLSFPLVLCLPAALFDHPAVLISAPRFSCLVQSPYVSGIPRSSSVNISRLPLCLLLLISTPVLSVICSPSCSSVCPLLMGIVGATTPSGKDTNLP